MHIPDGFLSYDVCGAAYAASAIALGAAVKSAEKDDKGSYAPALGVTAAFVFSAQMINFPVGGGTSGHFLGALFSAITLGPLNSILVMAVVLLIQCLMFADGGVTALGANLFNMGLVGGVLSYVLFAGLKAIAPDNKKWFVLSAAAAAWFSVAASSACCALELAWSGVSPLNIVLPAMLSIHSVIGIGEAIVTASALSVVMASRPDIIFALTPSLVKIGGEAKPERPAG